MRVRVGTLGEGERSAIGVCGNLAVGKASSDEEGPRSAHGQLYDVRHDPVERHLKNGRNIMRVKLKFTAVHLVLHNLKPVQV